MPAVWCVHVHLYNLGSIQPDELAADSIDTWHRSANLTKSSVVQQFREGKEWMNAWLQRYFFAQASLWMLFSIFQIHDARKGLGWAGQGVRWGGRGGMAFINLLLINTGKSYKGVKLTKILFRRRIGGVEEKKERKHLKQARSNKACHTLQNTNWSTLSCRSSSSIFWRSRGALNANLEVECIFSQLRSTIFILVKKGLNSYCWVNETVI